MNFWAQVLIDAGMNGTFMFAGYVWGRAHELRRCNEIHFQRFREVLQEIAQAEKYKPLSWRCMCCNKMREDEKISVMRYEIGIEHGFEQANHMTINVKYCNDNPECIGKAFTRNDWINWPKGA